MRLTHHIFAILTHISAKKRRFTKILGEKHVLVAEAEPVMRQLQRILAAFMPSEKEAQLEDEVVKPVLRLLGHTFEVQP